MARAAKVFATSLLAALILLGKIGNPQTRLGNSIEVEKLKDFIKDRVGM